MKVIFSLFAATLCALSPLFAQDTAIQWQNTIGGDHDEKLSSVQQTADGGYILGGSSSSNISGDKTENTWGGEDYWVVKLDATGYIQWQNTIGGNDNDELYVLQQTADGGYILGGSSFSNISGDKTENSLGNNDYWIVKLNASGNIQWQNTIGGNNYDYFGSIQETADGGYILGGGSYSNVSGDKTENSLGSEDFWVVKLDATGDIQWQNTIGGDDVDKLNSIQQTADGGYILGGYSGSDISSDKSENHLGVWDYWVVKINASGNIQWQNTIGGFNSDLLISLQQTVDGGYVLGGYSTSDISDDKTENSLGGSDFWVVKLNATGDIQWQNTIGGFKDDNFYSIQQTADGGYILGGSSDSNISGDKIENSLGGYDFWVVKLNSTGAIQWQNTIGGNLSESFRSLRQTADGGYILGGISCSNISGDKSENSWANSFDYWVIKLAPETVPTGEASTAPTGVTVYPNPATDVLIVHSEAATTLCLRNAFGQVISTQTIQGQSKIDLSRYPNGIYFLMEMETGFRHKILKVK